MDFLVLRRTGAPTIEDFLVLRRNGGEDFLVLREEPEPPGAEPLFSFDISIADQIIERIKI